MRDFLVSGTMPYILVMSVYFLVRFVMYLLPSKSKGTFLFKAQFIQVLAFGLARIR